jgi:hypothetical protein
MSVYLYWKTRNVQARNTSNILNNNLQVLEFDHRDGIEAYIEQNQCPFEESIDGVGYKCVSKDKTGQRDDVPPATRCTLCWIKKYINGTRVPKKLPARTFRYLRAVGFLGLRATQPRVQGSVATRYEIMKMSCQSWSSVEVTYVHPPQVKVRKMPTPAMNLGRDELGRRVKMYQRPTNANRGPRQLSMALHRPSFVPYQM